MEDMVDSTPVAPGTRPAEVIMVKIKNDEGVITEVPLLALMSNLFNAIGDIQLRLSVLESHLVAKDKRIIEV